MFKRIRSERGFTLVELLVVLAIMAILVALVVPNLTGLLTGTKETAMKQEKDVIQNALDTFYTQDVEIEGDPTSIPAATGYVQLTKNDGSNLFTKYLRRDTKYYYSWGSNGADLSVCETAAATDCY